MSNRLVVLFSILFSLGFTLPCEGRGGSTAQGPSCGGGGSVVLLSPQSTQVIALDLLAVDSQAQDPIVPEWNKALLDLMNPEKDYSWVDIKSLPAYQELKTRLMIWQPRSFNLIQLILFELEQLSFRFTRHCVTAVERYFVPESLYALYPQAQVLPAIYFDPKVGPIASVPLLLRSGRLTQQALLLHETLRRVQLFHQLNISDEKLQLLTGTIILRTDLARTQTLENALYLDQQLLQWILTKDPNRKIQSDLCEGLKANKLSDTKWKQALRGYQRRNSIGDGDLYNSLTEVSELACRGALPMNLTGLRRLGYTYEACLKGRQALGTQTTESLCPLFNTYQSEARRDRRELALLHDMAREAKAVATRVGVESLQITQTLVESFEARKPFEAQNLREKAFVVGTRAQYEGLFSQGLLRECPAFAP